jgi:hypothetical protein
VRTFRLGADNCLSRLRKIVPQVKAIARIESELPPESSVTASWRKVEEIADTMNPRSRSPSKDG